MAGVRAWDAKFANANVSGSNIFTDTLSGTDYPQVGDWLVAVVAIDNDSATTPTITAFASANIDTATQAFGKIDSPQATAKAGTILLWARAKVNTAYTSSTFPGVTLSASAARATTLAFIAITGSFDDANIAVVDNASTAGSVSHTVSHTIAANGALAAFWGSETNTALSTTSLGTPARRTQPFTASGGAAANQSLTLQADFNSSSTTFTWSTTTSDGGAAGIYFPPPSGTPATFTTTVGDATADGGTTSLIGDATFSTTVGDAAADGGTGSFVGQQNATFSTTVGDAAAAGGTGSFSNATNATFTTTEGQGTAEGGTTSLLGNATFSTTVGNAAADGGTGSFQTSSSVTFVTTVGDAAAAGGNTSFLTDGTFSTTVGDAAADGGTGSFVPSGGGTPATFSTTVGDAAADGGTTTFSGTSGGTFVTTAGDAAASGGTTVFSVPAQFSTTVGDATASGGNTSMSGTATFGTIAGDVAASGGLGSFEALVISGGVQLRGWSFRVLNAGVYYETPDWIDGQMLFDLADIGAFSGSYPQIGRNSDRVVDDAVVIAYFDGVEPFDGRWRIMAGKSDMLDDSIVTSFTGKSLMDIFRRVTIPPNAVSSTYNVSAVTPGNLLNTLFTAAQARSAMTGITWDFTNTVDSNGAAWDGTKLLTVQYKNGTKFLDLIRDLVDKGLIECRFNGTVFQVFKGTTMSTDRSSTIVLKAGDDYEELPTQWSSENRVKYSVTYGDDNTYVEKTDGTVPTGPFGIEEQAVSQGGTTNVGTLTIVNDAALDKVKILRAQATRKMVVNANSKIPTVDFKVGDWIAEVSPDPTSLDSDWVKYRVRSAVIDVDEGGTISKVSLTFNDKFLEQAIINARKIDGITGGIGGTNGTPSEPAPPDTTTPNAPTSLLFSSEVYQDQEGRTFALMTVSWTPPTTNTDASALTDLQYYIVEWKRDGTATWSKANTTEPVYSVAGLIPGAQYRVRVRAVDSADPPHISGYLGTATGSLSPTLVSDTTAPSQPAAPTATSARGVINATHGWTINGGGNLEPDTIAVEIHISQTSGFTPSGATLYATTLKPTTVAITGLVQNSNPWFLKAVAVDRSGNRSAASPQTSQVLNRIQGPDIQANSVTANEILGGTITGDKIAAGVLSTNELQDPSFEEDYAFTQWNSTSDAGETTQWRKTSGAPVRFVGDGRSGATSAHLPALAGAVCSLLTSTFPVTNGKTYRVIVHATALTSNAKLAVAVWAGPTPAGVQASGAPVMTSVGDWFTGEVPSVSVIDASVYQSYAAEFTADTDEFVAIRVFQNGPTAASTLVIDDVSVVEQGSGGASELTAAGLRLFDNGGSEVGAFVSNRPNYLSVTEVDPLTGVAVTLASVSEEGVGSFTHVDADTDIDVAGFPLLGNLLLFDSPTTDGAKIDGHLDKIPRGVIAYGVLGPGALTGNTWRRELSFFAEPGRSYALCFSGGLASFSAANQVGGPYIGIATPASVGGDAAGVAGTPVRYGYTHAPGTGSNAYASVPGIQKIVRANRNGTGSGGEINYGRNRMLLGVKADLATVTVEEAWDFWVEDLGPDTPETTVANTTGTGQSSATQTYTTLWVCNSSEAYTAGGTAETWTNDLQQGYYSSANGNQYSLALFTGNGVSGQAVSVATAMSGATLIKAEVFLYFKHWYYNSGGTAIVRANTLTSLASTAPSGSSVSSPNWPKPGGRWVDITSIWDTSKRGIWLGPGASSSLLYYGRAASHLDAAAYKPQLRLKYRK